MKQLAAVVQQKHRPKLSLVLDILCRSVQAVQRTRQVACQFFRRSFLKVAVVVVAQVAQLQQAVLVVAVEAQAVQQGARLIARHKVLLAVRVTRVTVGVAAAAVQAA